MDLAHYPLLNQADVLTGWYLDWGLVVVEPGVCVTAKPDQTVLITSSKTAYRPADIVGQDLGLHIARPVLLSIS